ncbi:hisA/hisF family protein [bacterium]|nr:hisA/hisF family protein [bacterium]
MTANSWILPVIDLLDGQVVRGVAGQRSEYQPIASRWCDTSNPLDITQALRQQFGFRRFYVADLDGILQQRPNLTQYQQLIEQGFELVIDAGIVDAVSAQALLAQPQITLVAGLESLASPQVLQELLQQTDPSRWVFSLDLRNGQPMASTTWPCDPTAIADIAISRGITRMIVLDLHDVGMGTGGSTVSLCRQLLQSHPKLSLIAGGGVRCLDDVAHWREHGVSQVLVASALHDCRISPDDWQRYSAFQSAIQS